MRLPRPLGRVPDEWVGWKERLLSHLSPHTVRKHLEHAYEKLGVRTRTAAVVRAFSPNDAPAC